MQATDHRLYCMSCPEEGLCKIGYTKFDPAEKKERLEKAHSKTFQFEWMRCAPGGKQRVLNIESWWKHTVNRETAPVEGEEFYDADPEWLRDKLREASELSQYPISFSKHHA